MRLSPPRLNAGLVLWGERRFYKPRRDWFDSSARYRGAVAQLAERTLDKREVERANRSGPTMVIVV